MTLDEAIERYTSNAEYERAHGNLQGCLDFKKLAEWLKDYKRLLEQEPCEDCVSRKKVLEYIDEMPSELTADGRRMIRRRRLEEYISDTLPPVDPQPRMGQWQQDLDGTYLCSECGSGFKEQPTLMGKPMFAWCPLCGAKMIEPKESEG